MVKMPTSRHQVTRLIFCLLAVLLNYLHAAAPQDEDNSIEFRSAESLTLPDFGHDASAGNVVNPSTSVDADNDGILEIEGSRLIINPTSQSWIVRDITFLGFSLNIKISDNTVRVKIISTNKDAATSKLYLETLDTFSRTEIVSEIHVPKARVVVSVLSGANDQSSNIPYLFESTSLPEQKYMPEVGNGHVATIVNGPYIFMNGLFNGLGSKSSRARIPSLVGFQFDVSSKPSSNLRLLKTKYVLNVKEGIFSERREYENPAVFVHREVFAHRHYDRLLVVRITASRPKGDLEKENVTITLTNVPDQGDISTVDLAFTPTRQAKKKSFNYADGTNILTELPATEKTTVTVAWTPIPDSFTVSAGKESSVVIIVAASTLHSEAIAAITEALVMPDSELKDSHIKKWDSYWKHGMIEVNPAENFPLAQAIYGSFYYLMSSLPNQQDQNNNFIGLSPGGLARGENNTNYSGHVFWDMETWMYPPILYFHPNQAAIMLEARKRTLDAAKTNAILHGYKGVKFAWESAYSGNETSPWAPSGDWEIHITGDVAFAIRQFLYLSPNKAEMIRSLNLKEIAIGIAEFWNNRSECNAGVCHIRVVMPPDEYHFPVNDSVYTNYAAKVSLELPAYILRLLGETGHDLDLKKWKETADSLIFLTGEKDGKQIHLEFEGFEPGVMNPSRNPVEPKFPTVKQADVILLGFPFDKNMTSEMRRNDLDIYLNVTDEDGPAMTWGMFAVGYLELGMKAKADQLFVKNFENVVEPFGVWSEVRGARGALNFLTGMGGFLQAIVNGYGGLRLHEDHIVFDPHQLPNVTKWSIRSFKYLGNELDLEFDFASMLMNVTGRREENGAQLVVVRNSSEIRNMTNITVPIAIQRIVIREYNTSDEVENFTSTYIATTSTYIATTAAAPSTYCLGNTITFLGFWMVKHFVVY